MHKSYVYQDVTCYIRHTFLDFPYLKKMSGDL